MPCRVSSHTRGPPESLCEEEEEGGERRLGVGGWMAVGWGWSLGVHVCGGTRTGMWGGRDAGWGKGGWGKGVGGQRAEVAGGGEPDLRSRGRTGSGYPRSPYLAGVLALFLPRTQHVTAENTRVEDPTILGAQDADLRALQAPVVLHCKGRKGRPVSPGSLALGPGSWALVILSQSPP